MKISDKIKGRSKTPGTPELVNIDRNILMGFGTLILAMMIIVLVTGIFFFHKVSDKDETQLQEIITGILADSINRVSFSGKYHARLLVEQVAQSQPRVEYVYVAGLDGNIIAHNDPSRNDQPVDRDTLDVVSQVVREDKTVISEREIDGNLVKQVAMGYRSGYQNEKSGVIVVGISTEEVHRGIRQTWFYMGIIIFALFLVSLVGVYLLGKVFGGPVKKMAWQLKGILDHAPLLISISDRESECISSSESFQDIAKESPEILDSELDEVFQTNGSVSREIPRKVSDEDRTFMARSFPIIKDSHGETSLACSMAVDVTDRKRAEESLRQSQANLQITLDSIGEAVIATDCDEKIVRMNPVAENLTGWTFSEVKGRELGDVFKIFVSQTQQKAENLIQKVLQTGEINIAEQRITLVSRDGIQRQIASSCSPIRDDIGQVLGAVLVFRDVTEELAMQEQLRQSQKMEAIGQLAGGVAHDFNNLLTAIMGNAQLLGMQFERESSEGKSLQEIVDAAFRAAELTKQLLAFSRKGQFQVVEVDIHQVIDEVIHLLSHTIDKRIQIKKDFHAAQFSIKGDPTQLQNAILNLAVNARDAMPEGGELIFATRIVELDDDYCRTHANEVKPGEFVEISVTDTGIGMDSETQKRIFEPFFTTKQVGVGTGLGLAGVYGCVKSHQGLVHVYSEPGQGSTFKILFPLSKGAAKPSDATVKENVIFGHGHVLVIDDEDLVRNFAAKALRKLGYTVTTCRDGIEALEYFDKNKDNVDIIILDLIMPKLSGEETFKSLRKVDPQARILISSGFTHNKTVNFLISQGALSFINKPFRIDELSHEIAYHIRDGDD